MSKSHPLRVGGLKFEINRIRSADDVPPLAGGWIEIRSWPSAPSTMPGSHPLRVGGLKSHGLVGLDAPDAVPPLAGGWIEIAAP